LSRNQEDYRSRRSAIDTSISKKLLYSAVTCIGFFLLIEFTLWIFAVVPASKTQDFSQGFSGLVSVFELKGDRLRTRPTTPYATFNKQSFLAQKPANGLRIFTLGGSSSYGFPWTGEVAFTAILGDVLAAAHPDRQIEAINVSGISYAMHRLAIVAKEIIAYEPDIFIIYSGHNEFIERSFFDELKQRRQWHNRIEHLLSGWRVYSLLRSLFAGLGAPEATRSEMFVRREWDVYDEQQKRRIVSEYQEGLGGSSTGSDSHLGRRATRDYGSA